MKGWQDEIADRGGNVHRLIASLTNWRDASYAGLTRVSIYLRKYNFKRMNCRVISDQVGDRRPAMTMSLTPR
jgi:hypothetical protein